MDERIITITVKLREIDREEECSWIWESHKDGTFYNGVKVIQISEGSCHHDEDF